jgi:hypothetical protein
MSKITDFPGLLLDRLALSMASVGFGATWLALLMRPYVPAGQLGPICGHAREALPHCPACYVAAALIAAGVVSGVAGSWAATRRALAGGGPVSAA